MISLKVAQHSRCVLLYLEKLHVVPNAVPFIADRPQGIALAARPHLGVSTRRNGNSLICKLYNFVKPFTVRMCVTSCDTYLTCWQSFRLIIVKTSAPKHTALTNTVHVTLNGSYGRKCVDNSRGWHIQDRGITWPIWGQLFANLGGNLTTKHPYRRRHCLPALHACVFSRLSWARSSYAPIAMKSYRSSSWSEDVRVIGCNLLIESKNCQELVSGKTQEVILRCWLRWDTRHSQERGIDANLMS